MNRTCSPRRFAQTALLALLLSAVLALPACAGFVEGVVPTESGFAGAVTVVSEEADGPCGVVTVRVPYLGVLGDEKTGLARVVFPRKAALPGTRLPAFCHVHYEKDTGGAKQWAGKGWAVFTAAYTGADGESPIDVSVGNGNNLARAVIQWARRCPFVDPARMHIDGGSQGGYMALAMSADMFPVTSTTADVPVVNWCYNIGYLEANRAHGGYPGHEAESPLPVMGMVTGLAEMAYAYFPRDLSADAWYWLSPISMLDRIANPVLVTSATGDMLVPMEQMSRTHFRAPDPALFPEGYRRDFDGLTANEKARKVFEECLPPEKVFIHVEPRPEDGFAYTREMILDPKKMPQKKQKHIDKTWSPEHQWSLFYMDEGGPLPFAGHNSWNWNAGPDSFTAHYRDAVPDPSVLNAAKLLRLMERHEGKLSNLPLLNSGAPANRCNHADAERRDVRAGLAAYAALGADHAARLKALYAECPLKALGETLPADIAP